MHLKSILNRVEPLKSFVYKEQRLVEVAGQQPFLETDQVVLPLAVLQPLLRVGDEHGRELRVVQGGAAEDIGFDLDHHRLGLGFDLRRLGHLRRSDRRHGFGFDHDDRSLLRLDDLWRFCQTYQPAAARSAPPMRSAGQFVWLRRWARMGAGFFGVGDWLAIVGWA